MRGAAAWRSAGQEPGQAAGLLLVVEELDELLLVDVAGLAEESPPDEDEAAAAGLEPTELLEDERLSVR